MKVCVYAICKNESQFVDRWMDSMREADCVVVTDTGSTDDTVERLKARGAQVYTETVSPWRFDRARNLALSHVPEDADICVCTDLDEVLEAGWRPKLEAAWKPGTTRCHYHYTWSFNADGTPGVTFLYDHIHARHTDQWVNPVHECLNYIGRDKEQHVWCPDVKLGHYPDPAKNRSGYLPLLELAVAEQPEEPRNYHYLGREYMFAGQWEKSIPMLEKYLQMADWKEERGASMRFIARDHKALGRVQEAKCWLYRALAETPGLREPYTEMARLLYDEKDWAGVWHMVSDALKIKERSAYINEPWCWDYTLYDLGALGAYYLGLREISLEYANTALAMRPGDGRLKSNVALIGNALAK
jgi:Glycosyltransferases involved in cell wall biogenesis